MRWRLIPHGWLSLGTPVPVVEQVATTGTGGVNSRVAATATLVYVPGGITSTQRSLVWVDRQGREEPIRLPQLTTTGHIYRPMARVLRSPSLALKVRMFGCPIWDAVHRAE